MVAQGFSPGVETYKYGNPDVRRGGIMPMLQYVASLCATPPSGGVRFVFFAIPTGFVRVAHSTPWLLYAASPYGEALKFRSPASRQLPIYWRTQARSITTILITHRIFVITPTTYAFRSQVPEYSGIFLLRKMIDTKEILVI